MNDPAIHAIARLKARIGIFGLVSVAVSLACVYVKFNPIAFFTEFHYVRDLLGEMFMPDFRHTLSNPSLIPSIVQTLSMAFLGTLFGCSLALVLAFFAAGNTMPWRVVRLGVRVLLSVTRAFPALVMILVFVVAVGLGPFSGMLTLIFITVGTFGKLFADNIEQVETAPAEAIYSVGANRMQVIRYSILPQVLPSMIANMLYAFDVNLRTAISLGIFGGGGIGLQLNMAIRVLHYKDATTLICLIIVLVILFEKISDFFRKRILADGLSKT